MKTWIVRTLEDACVWTGHRFGCLLADWSAALNARWGLDHWTTDTDRDGLLGDDRD